MYLPKLKTAGIFSGDIIIILSSSISLEVTDLGLVLISYCKK